MHKHPHAHRVLSDNTLRTKSPRSRGLEWILGAGAVVRHESFCGLGLLCIHESGKPLPQKAFAEDMNVVPVVGTVTHTEIWTSVQV